MHSVLIVSYTHISKLYNIHTNTYIYILSDTQKLLAELTKTRDYVLFCFLYIAHFARVGDSNCWFELIYSWFYAEISIRQWQYFYSTMEISFCVQIHNTKWISMSQSHIHATHTHTKKAIWLTLRQVGSHISKESSIDPPYKIHIKKAQKTVVYMKERLSLQSGCFLSLKWYDWWFSSVRSGIFNFVSSGDPVVIFESSCNIWSGKFIQYLTYVDDWSKICIWVRYP